MSCPGAADELPFRAHRGMVRPSDTLKMIQTPMVFTQSKTNTSTVTYAQLGFNNRDLLCCFSYVHDNHLFFHWFYKQTDHTIG